MRLGVQEAKTGAMDTTAFPRAELTTEAGAGFPRLRRAPQTKIIQFSTTSPL